MIRIGIPRATRRRVANGEKYPNMAVLTLSPAPTEKGKTWRMTLNSKAVATLAYNTEETNYVSLVRDYSDEDGLVNIGLANTTSSENNERFRLSNSGTFTNKAIYNYIADYYNFDTSVENELKLYSLPVGAPSDIPRYMYLARITEERDEAVNDTELVESGEAGSIGEGTASAALYADIEHTVSEGVTMTGTNGNGPSW